MQKLQHIRTVISILLLSIPLLGCAQTIQIKGLGKVIIGGQSGGVTAPVDTSYRTLEPGTQVITYDPLRPNVQITQTADETLFINGVLTGFSGKLRVFISSGVLHLNGVVNVSIPGSGTFVTTYTPVFGIINYN